MSIKLVSLGLCVINSSGIQEDRAICLFLLFFFLSPTTLPSIYYRYRIFLESSAKSLYLIREGAQPMDSELNQVVSKYRLWTAEEVGVSKTLITDHAKTYYLSTGLREIDDLLPDQGLSRGAVHEWQGGRLRTEAPTDQIKLNAQRTRLPEGYNLDPLQNYPITIPSILAIRAYLQHSIEIEQSVLTRETNSYKKYLVWLGRDIWPTPYLLSLGEQLWRSQHAESPTVSNSRIDELLNSSLFLDPPLDHYLWSLERTLRSTAICAVIALHPEEHYTGTRSAPNRKAATVSKLIAISKRLSLAAKQSGNIGFLLARSKLIRKTASASRWTISTLSSLTDQHLWRVDLEQIKGALPAERSWTLRLDLSEMSSPTLKID